MSHGAEDRRAPSADAEPHTTSFLYLLDRDPEYAANLLPILHREGDHDRPINRRNYANEIANSNPSCAQWDALFQNGHLTHLVNIAAEDDMYRLVSPGPDVRVINKANVEYTASVLLALLPATLELYLLSLDQVRRSIHEDVIEIFFANIPRLWSTWWRHISTFVALLDADLKPEMKFLADEAGEEGDFFLSIIGDIIKLVMRIYAQHQDRIPLLSDRVAHLALLSWVYVRGPLIRNRELLGAIHQIVACDPSSSNPVLHLSNITALFHDTMNGRVAATKHLARALHRDLVDESVLDVHLQSLMNVFCLVVFHYPAAAQIPVKKKSLTLYALAACTRQLCMGSEEWNYGTIRLGLIGLRGKAMDTENRTIDNLLADGQGVIALELLSLVIVSAIERHDEEFIEAISEILSSCGIIGRTLRNGAYSGRSAESMPPALRHFLHHIETRWYPLLNTLRSVDVEPDNLKQQVILYWLRLGAEFGMDETRERRRIREEIASIPVEFLPTCRNSTCLCSKVKPFHKMHACKGCWRVFYCSPKCQRMDWQDGHRENCVGRHRSAV